MSLPNDDYYQRCVGSWRCPMNFAVTDWRGFWGSKMSWLDRVRVLSLALWPSRLIRFYLSTTVSRLPGKHSEDVLHTTRVSCLGVGFMKSTERIELDPGGREFQLTGTRSMWPTFWVNEPFAAPGEVDAEASQATYDFSWFGTSLKQTTVASEDLVLVTQETAWSLGKQRLVRTS